jgi:hypothetical protein
MNHGKSLFSAPLSTHIEAPQLTRWFCLQMLDASSG